jgi:hypothetical protein
MAEDPEEPAEEGDFLGDLAFVAANPQHFTKEQLVDIIKAAIPEILDLRLQLALTR